MQRLNDRAFEILKAEVQKCAAANGGAGKIQKEIVMKRLERLRQEQGNPASQVELEDKIIDIFPQFNQKSLKEAANVNRPQSKIFNKIIFTTGMVAGLTGVIAVLNLPFPMIRRPVANVAPFLLLPSFISMDYHYRQAIGLVEQADQLVNQATSIADINLGEIKVKESQKHLDALPVWFLDYYPQAYCGLFGCTWRFTFDEFQGARKNIARMEAKVFQEKNAFTQLTEAENLLNSGKEQYKLSQNNQEKQQAIANWQTAIDKLNEIPPATLAGKMSKNKIQVAQRDFKGELGYDSGNQRTGTFIEVAKQYAMAAAQQTQNPPHSVMEWEQIANLWEQSIQQLRQVSNQDAGYLDAQKKIAEYTKNLGITKVRKEAEKDSVEALKRAKDRIAEWQILAGSKDPNIGRLSSALQLIINELDKVQPGTNATKEAQELRGFAQKKLKELQP